MNSTAIFVIIIILAFVISFFLTRELNCWYWKINERVKMQKEIIELLKICVRDRNGNDDLSDLKIEIAVKNISLNSLTSDEIEIYEKLKSKGLKDGDAIILHKSLRSVIKVTNSEWNSYGNYQNDWLIIKE